MEFRLEITSEGGNQARVDVVGLGPLRPRLGIMPDLARVDDYHRQHCGSQFTNRQPLELAGCLQHDATRAERLQPLQELSDAVRLVADGKLLAARQNRYVQLGLADIDAD